MICDTLQWLHTIGPDIGWLPVIAVVAYGSLMCWAAVYGNLASSALYIPVATVGLVLILLGTGINEVQRGLYGCQFDPGMCGYSSRTHPVLGCVPASGSRHP